MASTSKAAASVGRNAHGYLKYVTNRNPLNLHKMRIAPRPTGYDFEKRRERMTYTYRVELHVSKKNTVGLVRHCSDGVVLRATTSDWALRKRLYSGVDVCAAQAVGEVLGELCRRADLLELNADVHAFEAPTAVDATEKAATGAEAGVAPSTVNARVKDWADGRPADEDVAKNEADALAGLNERAHRFTQALAKSGVSLEELTTTLRSPLDYSDDDVELKWHTDVIDNPYRYRVIP